MVADRAGAQLSVTQNTDCRRALLCDSRSGDTNADNVHTIHMVYVCHTVYVEIVVGQSVWMEAAELGMTGENLNTFTNEK